MDGFQGQSECWLVRDEVWTDFRVRVSVGWSGMKYGMDCRVRGWLERGEVSTPGRCCRVSITFSCFQETVRYQPLAVGHVAAGHRPASNVAHVEVCPATRIKASH